MGLIEQDLAEGLFVQSRFLYAGEEVERALRPHQTQVGELFDAVGGVEDAVAVGGDIFLPDLLSHGERLNGGALRDRRRGVDKRAVDAVHHRQQLRLGDDHAHAPAGHQEILGKAVERDGALGHAGQCADGAEVALVEIGGIDLVGGNEQVMLLRDAGEQLERLSVVAHAGGVRGIVENDGLGARGDGGAQTRFVDGVVLARVGRHVHAYAACQLDLLAVHGEVGREGDDLVAGVEDGEHHERHAEAARRAHEHMVARETLAEVLLPRAADRVDQLGVALGVAVVRVTGLRVAEGGVDDALVGGEIGVADAQVDDVLVFGKRLGVERQSGGAALKSLGDVAMLHAWKPP